MTIYHHSVSFNSFYGHSSTGMTWNDIPLKWQEWCWNDGFGHSQHIPLIPVIPVIPDCWEKWGHSWFHPCHSGLIPSFGVIRKFSTNVNFPRMTSEWRKILSWSGPVSLRANVVTLCHKADAKQKNVSVKSKSWICKDGKEITACFVRLPHTMQYILSIE